MEKSLEEGEQKLIPEVMNKDWQQKRNDKKKVVKKE
jgi:hypothetical protein